MERGEDSPDRSLDPCNLEPRNLELLVEYTGAAFAGWQIQPDRLTVAGALEQALEQITRHPAHLVAASRTDAGVHALGQVASLKTHATIDCRRLRRGLNAVLPPQVAVRRVREVDPEFHARFSARGKHYRYRIFNRSERCPLEAEHSWHEPLPLDHQAMDAAALRLIGEHDFSALASGPIEEERGSVRRLRAVRVRSRPALAGPWLAGAPGVVIEIDVIGDSFLYKMVRTIAGTLVLVGRGRLRPAAIEGILAGKLRAQAGPTAPPQGLTLLRVFYDDHELSAAADSQLEGTVHGDSGDRTRYVGPGHAAGVCRG